jgi:hypothetical protein
MGLLQRNAQMYDHFKALFRVTLANSFFPTTLCHIFGQKLTVPEVPRKLECAGTFGSQNLVPKVCECIIKSGHTFGRRAARMYILNPAGKKVQLK